MRASDLIFSVTIRSTYTSWQRTVPGTREKPDIEPLYQSAKQHLWLKLVLDLYAEFLMASCNQLQGKAFLRSLSCPHHPVLSMTWLFPHVTQESIKALASLTRSFACPHPRHAVTSLTRFCTHITNGPISARGFKHLIFHPHIGLGAEQQFAQLGATKA